MFVREAKRLLRQLVFAGERSREHGRVVGIEGSHQALIEVLADGMIGKGTATSGAQVTGETDFNRDLAVGEFLDKFGVLDGGEAMADALGAQVERPPDRTGAGGFSRMRRDPQAVVAGVSINVTE